MKTEKIPARYLATDETGADVWVTNINACTEQELLREGNRSVILDLEQLFSDERNESKRYKIYGKIKMIFRNMYSGTTEYTPLLKNFYLKRLLCVSKLEFQKIKLVAVSKTSKK